MQRATRRFVRHQANWFRLDDPRVRWFEAVPDPCSEILDLVSEFANPAR
jgi:tRNA dimethylallyltransferase